MLAVLMPLNRCSRASALLLRSSLAMLFPMYCKISLEAPKPRSSPQEVPVSQRSAVHACTQDKTTRPWECQPAAASSRTCGIHGCSHRKARTILRMSKEYWNTTWMLALIAHKACVAVLLTIKQLCLQTFLCEVSQYDLHAERRGMIPTKRSASSSTLRATRVTLGLPSNRVKGAWR